MPVYRVFSGQKGQRQYLVGLPEVMKWKLFLWNQWRFRFLLYYLLVNANFSSLLLMYYRKAVLLYWIYLSPRIREKHKSWINIYPLTDHDSSNNNLNYKSVFEFSSEILTNSNANNKTGDSILLGSLLP